MSRLNCIQCEHRKEPQGGHCYMFRVKPNGDYCAQFRASDTVRMRIDLIKLLNQPNRKVG